MIIGRFSVDPMLIYGGRIEFNPETKCYHVFIETDETVYEQAVEKQADAAALLKLIDKATSDGATARREALEAVSTAKGDDD